MYIENTAINYLMYADDIIILSIIKVGLQNRLNSLQKYTENWKLQVNTEKMQVSTLNKGGKLLKTLIFALVTFY